MKAWLAMAVASARWVDASHPLDDAFPQAAVLLPQLPVLP